MAKYNIKINLSALNAVLQRSIQRTIDIVSLGLISAEQITDTGALKLPGAFFHVSPAANFHLDFESARTEFKKWALMGGIRDCIEAVNTFLESVHPICFLYSVGSPLKGEVWNIGMNSKTRINFHKRGLPSKIDFLVTEYAPILRPELTDEVISINKARNCMVHRNGIVSVLDKNSEDGLLVRWRKIQFIAKGPNGQRAVTGGSIVKAGEELSIQQVESHKLFLIGESISFPVEEFSELCLTVMLFGRQLVDNINNYGRTRGIQFNPKNDKGLTLD
ncbi:hypothetical protein ACFLVU_05815 [Chloroflexota bacterium]